MSISVDDLVATLSSNHIGQEAIDLASLQVRPSFSSTFPSTPRLKSPMVLKFAQTQLSQTLFTQHHYQGASAPLDGPYSQPCNTPTVCTPSSSFILADSSRRRRLSCAAGGIAGDFDVSEKDEMEIDEVEGILVPSSPILSPTSPSTFPYGAPQSPFVRSRKGSVDEYLLGLTSQPLCAPGADPPSVFTSTDPFYNAELMDTTSSPQSFFAQSGRPPVHSPFLLHHSTPASSNHHRNHPPLQLDTRSILVTSHSFQR
jgi:hypothetical protein